MFSFECDSLDCKNLASLFVDALFYDAMSSFASLLTELVLVEEERSVDFVVVGREVVRNLGNSELFIADLNTSPPSFFLYFLR